MLILRGPLDKLDAALKMLEEIGKKVAYVCKGSPHRQDIPQRFWIKADVEGAVDFKGQQVDVAFDAELDGVQVICITQHVTSYFFRDEEKSRRSHG
jgi:hypothetical protein